MATTAATATATHALLQDNALSKTTETRPTIEPPTMFSAGPTARISCPTMYLTASHPPMSRFCSALPESETVRLTRDPSHSQWQRYNPLGDDEEDDDDDGQYGAREEGEEREGDLDPQVRAFLERQHASQPHDVESMRLREERIKAGGMRNVKSRYQREKEEAQRKKEQAEREAAEAYDEFVRAMDGGGGGGSSSLSSAQAGKDRRAAMGFVSAGGEATGVMCGAATTDS